MDDGAPGRVILCVMKHQAEFITITEAVGLTGKSKSTLLRLAKRKARTRAVKKQNGAFLLSLKLVLDTYGKAPEQPPLHDAPNPLHEAPQQDELVQELRARIASLTADKQSLNRQMDELMKQNKLILDNAEEESKRLAQLLAMEKAHVKQLTDGRRKSWWPWSRSAKD